MLRLVIFDFDGLMVNSEEVVFEALKKLYKKHNNELNWEYFLRHIGKPFMNVVRKFYSDYPFQISFEEFMLQRRVIIHEYLTKRLRLMPGLLSLLKSINKKEISMAIATSANKEYIRNNLERFNISGYFKTIVTIEDVKRGKPHPDIYLEVLRKTGFSSTEALALEDSSYGIEAAYKAKITSIAVPTKGLAHSRFNRASYICKNLREASKLISSMINF